MGPDAAGMPALPDHWTSIEAASEVLPFRLVTAPARNFLNTTFTETPTSAGREQRPTAFIHPEDAADLRIGDGAAVRLGNDRGTVKLHARLFDGVRRGVVIGESNSTAEGRGGKGGGRT